MTNDISETAKAVVRRNTIEVQGGGNRELFDELFADDFHDHTPQPGGKPDKAGVLELYRRLWEAFPDFTPEIHCEGTQMLPGLVFPAPPGLHGIDTNTGIVVLQRHEDFLSA